MIRESRFIAEHCHTAVVKDERESECVSRPLAAFAGGDGGTTRRRAPGIGGLPGPALCSNVAMHTRANTFEARNRKP